MVTAAQLYAATNCGLDIIALHYPEAAECARTNNPFKYRPEERTPSARIKKFGDVWKVTDFGLEEKAISPIDIHMASTGLNFPQAVQDLAQRFGITEEVNRSVNRPTVRKRPATADEEDGDVKWDIDQEFTDAECKIMGPKVTREHLKALHWYRVKTILTVRNREVTEKSSNENYPIFMRECWFVGPDGKKDKFYKIYEPLNIEKRWRFQYQPAGKKPKEYINGLEELRAEWQRVNDEEEKNFFKDPENEGKPYKERKLPEAIICSGERDAICVRSLGYFPLWFNSETHDVTAEEWSQIKKYVEVVYNIPDIDTTGRSRGTKLALQYIDIHTVWLPDKLATFRDHRGHPCKDFRDWIALWPEKSEFCGLLELAAPARFWRETKKKESREIKYSIDIVCLYEFLKLNGFYALNDKHAASTQFVRIEGNIVKLVTSKEIRDFVLQWAESTYQKRDLRNLILSTPTLSAASLEAMKEINPDFTNFTEKSQFFYFPKFSVEVTAAGIQKYDNRTTTTGRYVWEENVIGHDIKIFTDPIFEITHPEGSYESEDFDIVINAHNSNYFRYLINSSRIYWRKELEEYVGTLSPEEAEAYRQTHKFDIAGPSLSPEEIQEQKQCLINKIFTIGFMLHRYKSESRAWAPFVMDNVVGENDQCNGRSGKSFMFRALSYFTKWLKLSGRNPKLLEGQFAFEQINKHLGIVVVDDCDEYLPFKQFYDNITSDITINTKNVSAYTLKFEEAPKFAFTTNYVPKEFDGSSVGRMLFVVFSDYYHQKTEENDYNETRQIRTDFNKDLFGSSYSEGEWEADINFMLQCVRFYLSVASLPVKIEPKMGNIIFRKFLRDMSDNFRDWAESYFAVDANGNGEHVNRDVVRLDAYEDYKRSSGAIKTTAQKFMKMLRGFVFTSEDIEELNPEEMHNSGSRILRDIEDPVTHVKKKMEVIYLRTKSEAARLRNPPPAPPQQEELPF